MISPHAGKTPLLDVEIRHLKLVQAIAEEGTVTAAGRRLHLTQSALSHQLSDVEGRLGVQLFTRSKRGLSPTAAGTQVLALSREILEKLQTASGALAVLSGQERNTLRIATECYTCYHWLPPILKQLNARYPLLEVVIEAGATPDPLAALGDDRIDLAVVTSPVKTRSFAVKPLFEDEMVAVLSPIHPFAKKSYLSVTDFATQTALVYSAPKREMLVFRKVFFPRKAEPKRTVHVQLTEAIIEMTKANLGIGILTRWSVDREVAEGRLVALPIEKQGLHRTWRAAYRKEKKVPAYIPDFIELLATSNRLPARLRQSAIAAD